MDDPRSRFAALAARPEVRARLAGAEWCFRAPALRVLSLCAQLLGDPFEQLVRQVWLIGAGTQREEGAVGWLTRFPSWEDLLDQADVTELGELRRVLEAFFPWAPAADGEEPADEADPFRDAV